MGRRRKLSQLPDPFTRIVITCEHASNAVPEAFAPLFRRASVDLNSHRGWDPGTLPLAKAIARRFHAPLFVGKWSRLLVDLNRSPGNRGLFSPFTASLDPAARALIADRFHAPHWHAVEHEIAHEIEAGGTVLHLGVHSFTPVLNAVRRTADFALLYDPRRPIERAFCSAWLERLKQAQTNPALRLRRNYPYLGTSDALTTHLRKRFPADRYAGIEIELNQALLPPRAKGPLRFPARVEAAAIEALAHALDGSR